MSLAGGDDVIVGAGLLKHQPHGLDVLAGMAPIALGVQVAEGQVLGAAGKNAGDAGGDFAGDELESAARRFVIKEDAA